MIPGNFKPVITKVTIKKRDSDGIWINHAQFVTIRVGDVISINTVQSSSNYKEPESIFMDVEVESIEGSKITFKYLDNEGDRLPMGKPICLEDQIAEQLKNISSHRATYVVKFDYSGVKVEEVDTIPQREVKQPNMFDFEEDM